MDTVRSFKGLDIAPIQSYLSKCDAPFETSPLYSTETEETYVDTDRRKSIYRTIVDPALFRMVEDLMVKMNEGDGEYSFVLWKNGSDITHIKYEEGGFFKCHRDFNSTTSNLIEEFSLIICVTPEEEAQDVVGGETAIVTFGGVDGKPVERVFDTKTPGCALLFRKDLNHEGKKVQGVKHIITANVFGVKKNQSEQVLYVTFPESENGESVGNSQHRNLPTTCAACGKGGNDLKICTACKLVKYCNVACQKSHRPKHRRECSQRASELKDKAAAMAAIMQVANDSKSYVLPVSCLTGMLESHVRFSNAQADAEGSKPAPVVPFVCHDFTFEEFGVVARILNRCYVDEDSISRAKACLDYFGPFNVENLLVDLALEPSAKHPPEKKQKQETNDDSRNEETHEGFDADIIVCENEARMKAVLNTARDFDQPYVPFKILFVEGMLHSFDGDMGGEIYPFDVPMTAAAAFVGDYNNVFALWSLDQYRESTFTLKQAHLCSPFFECSPEDQSERLLNLDLGSKVELFEPPPGSEYSSWEMPFKMNFSTSDGKVEEREIESEEFLRGGMGLGLNVRVTDSELKSGLLKYMFNKYDRSDVKPLDLRAGLSKESSVVQPVNSFFHLDENGKACFTRDQAHAASDFIASIDLEERVKASLNKKKFELPQVSEKVSMVYCNDDRYGKMNVLWVCGVLRLEKNDSISLADESDLSTKDAKHEKFDAWPSNEAKEKIQHAKRLADKYNDIIHDHGELPDKWWKYDSDVSSSFSLSQSDEESD